MQRRGIRCDTKSLKLVVWAIERCLMKFKQVLLFIYTIPSTTVYKEVNIWSWIVFFVVRYSFSARVLENVSVKGNIFQKVCFHGVLFIKAPEARFFSKARECFFLCFPFFSCISYFETPLSFHPLILLLCEDHIGAVCVLLLSISEERLKELFFYCFFTWWKCDCFINTS